MPLFRARHHSNKFTSFICPLVSICFCLGVSVSSSQSPSFPFLPSFSVRSVLFLLFMPIFMDTAMDLKRSVRFHEIKGSCLKKYFCVRWCMYHEIAEIFIAFAGNRNNNHTVLRIVWHVFISLSLSHSRCVLIFLLLFRNSRVTLFYLLLSFLNLTPSNDFRWHFMRISILC